jgi:hypothetical protein
MFQISLERTFAPNREVLVRDVDREAVLLDLEAGTYFGLNGVGTRIWHLLEHDGRLRIVFDALCEEYEAAPDDIERDLLALVTRLVEARLGELH